MCPMTIRTYVGGGMAEVSGVYFIKLNYKKPSRWIMCLHLMVKCLNEIYQGREEILFVVDILLYVF